MLGHQWQLDHFTQRTVSQLRDDSRRQAIFRCCFNYQGELRGRLGKFDGGLRRRILCSIDDVAPVKQVREWLGGEAGFFSGDRRNQFGGRFVSRVARLTRARLSSEFLSVKAAKETA